MTRPTTTAVVVTYEPGPLGGLLEALAPQCDAVLVVDNGSAAPGLGRAREACAAHGARLIELGENLGIAAAQNRGIAAAREQGAQYVLLSDQDSIPSPTMVAQLLEAIEEDGRIAAVGPLPAEEREGADELVYVDRGWSPKRATKAELARPRLEVAFLIASGCLVRMRALEEIGPMREDLFIDHVDLEWGVRARRAGWRLVAVPAARLAHSLGDEVVRLPGRAQPIHVRADPQLLHPAQHARAGGPRLAAAGPLARPVLLLGHEVRGLQRRPAGSARGAASDAAPGAGRRPARPPWPLPLPPPPALIPPPRRDRAISTARPVRPRSSGLRRLSSRWPGAGRGGRCARSAWWAPGRRTRPTRSRH